jgi:hypothetical protein
MPWPKLKSSNSEILRASAPYMIDAMGRVCWSAPLLGRWHRSAPSGTSIQTSPGSDQLAVLQNLKVDETQGTYKPTSSPAEDRRSPLPKMTLTEPVVNHCSAGFNKNSNSKIVTQREIIGGVINSGSNSKKGRHTLGMGLNPLSTKPAIGYQPMPGLVRLFSKTGTKQNPNQRHRKATLKPKTPPLHKPSVRCSYADAVHKGMEGKGAPLHRNGQGNIYRGHPSGGSRGNSQAEAYGRGGYQRPYQRIGGGGYYGSRGGGRWGQTCSTYTPMQFPVPPRQ